MKSESTYTAFQILVEFTVIYQYYKEELHGLSKLASELERENPAKGFLELLHATDEIKKEMSQVDEDLFIQEEIISNTIKQGMLYEYSDRIEIFTQILYWVREYAIQLPEKDELQQFLLISTTDCEKVYHFISDENEENTPYIIYLPIYDKNQPKLEGAWIDKNIPNQTPSDYFTSTAPLSYILKIVYFDSAMAFLTATLSPFKPNKMISWARLLPGDSIEIGDEKAFSFSEAKNILIATRHQNHINLTVNSVTKQYHRKILLKDLSFSASPGNLIGIVGKEGTGKSTILKLLAGKEKPSKGEIEINHHNFRKNQYLLKGAVGYVPEEDLLINELSVEENLMIAARLYLGKEKNEAIKDRVEWVIHFLGLHDVRFVCPGAITEKHLQPGERRLVNIGLELLRDPSILIVDNATHSLGMNETGRIIEKLAAYTFEGKIVITTITQTHESVFRSFDQIILLDQEGHPVYAGLRTEAIRYFKQFYPEGVIEHYNEDKYTPDALINLINEKEVDLRSGKRVKRFHSPYFLFEKFRTFSSRNASEESKKALPVKILKPPSLERQYLLYNLRNIKTLINNKQNFFFTLLSAPILAFIMAVGLKHSSTAAYSLYTNVNLDSFFFLSIIVFMLLGMLQSAETIFKERFLLEKEIYINLSRFSYMNAKISLNLFIVLIQAVVYSITSCIVLNTAFIFVPQTMIIFTAASFGTFLGLLLSATVKHLNSIFTKFIPLIILLQVIFGGGLILPNKIKSYERPYPSVITELMVSKWLHEALVTKYHQLSPYQNLQHDNTRKYILYHQYATIGIQVLRSKLEEIKNGSQQQKSQKQHIKLIKNTLTDLAKNEPELIHFQQIDKLASNKTQEIIINELEGYLKYLELYFQEKAGQYKNRLVNTDDSLRKSLKDEGFDNFKAKYQNLSINNLLYGNDNDPSYLIYNNRLIFINQPINQLPLNNWGRSIYYTSIKKFNGQFIPTFHFDLTVVWFFNLLCYILLITNIFTPQPHH